MGTAKATGALDARPRAVRAGQRVAPTPAVPAFRKSFPTPSLRLLVPPTTFHRKGRVGRVGRARPTCKRLFTVAPLRSRYGRGAAEARDTALAGGCCLRPGQEYQFDVGRALETGSLDASARTGAVSVALGRLEWRRDVLGRLRRRRPTDTESLGPGVGNG